MIVEQQMTAPLLGSLESVTNISGLVSDRKRHERALRHSEDAEVSELVGLAASGDRDAFGRLYQLYYPSVYRLARFTLREDAEDAAAETFLRAWQALPRYRATGAPFRAWLYGIARHVVADRLRAMRRVEPRDELPDRPIDNRYEDHADLAGAIARLPKRQRQIIEMKYLMGITNPEVAAALGTSVGAVNAQQWRALKALRKALEPR